MASSSPCCSALAANSEHTVWPATARSMASFSARTSLVTVAISISLAEAGEVGLAALAPAEADVAGQAPDAEGRDQALLDRGQAHHRVGGADPDVAGQRELEAASEAVAVDAADDRLRHLLAP